MHGSAGSHSRSAPLWGKRGEASWTRIYTRLKPATICGSGRDLFLMSRAGPKSGGQQLTQGLCFITMLLAEARVAADTSAAAGATTLSVCFFQGVAKTQARQILLLQQQLHFRLIPFSEAFLIVTECVCSWRHDRLSNTPSRIVVA